MFVKVILDPRIEEIDIITDCCWALAYLTDAKNSKSYQMILEGGGI